MKKNNNSLFLGRGDPLPLAMLIGFFQSFAIGYVTLGIVYYAADRFHANSATIGILASTYTATYALSCFFLNKPISRLKPYHALMIGVTVQAVLSQLIFRVNSLAMVTVIYLAFGVCTGLIWPPVMGWMSRGRDGAHLNRAMSAYNFSWSIPWMLSPFFTGVLYEKSQVLPFYFCTVFSVLVVLGTLTYLTLFKEVKKSAESEHNIKKDVHKAEDRSTPLRYLTWISLYPSYILMGLVGSIFPIFLRSSFALPESQVGLIILIRAGVTIICFYILGRTSFWHFNRKMIIFSTLVMAVLLGLFAGAHDLWHYMVWTVLAGVIIGYFYTNSMFHCLSGAVERQKRMNTHETILTVAMLTGSLLGGIFLDNYGMNFILKFVAAAMASAFLVQLIVSKLQEPKTSKIRSKSSEE